VDLIVKKPGEVAFDGADHRLMELIEWLPDAYFVFLGRQKSNKIVVFNQQKMILRARRHPINPKKKNDEFDIHFDVVFIYDYCSVYAVSHNSKIKVLCMMEDSIKWAGMVVFAVVSLVFCEVAVGQERLGYTADEIEGEFADEKYELNAGWEDGEYFVSVWLDEVYVVYRFDEDVVCTRTIILPLTQEKLDEFTESYIAMYEWDSERKWVVEKEEGVAEIEFFMIGPTPLFEWRWVKE